MAKWENKVLFKGFYPEAGVVSNEKCLGWKIINVKIICEVCYV